MADIHNSDGQECPSHMHGNVVDDQVDKTVSKTSFLHNPPR
ncbi:hypothetical protein RBSH_01572 [Rhodopirellula baltica SH28]|uniref:Uncharacterized protein n=1 Tax=Rhodopirellula baltica SH28 TaxID=993517 RepID=K5DJR9_RHOBT|nr:hypothetical protein RBSH_01572 [Rhodopirellula baltica SH28]